MEEPNQQAPPGARGQVEPLGIQEKSWEPSMAHALERLRPDNKFRIQTLGAA